MQVLLMQLTGENAYCSHVQSSFLMGLFAFVYEYLTSIFLVTDSFDDSYSEKCAEAYRSDNK